MVISAGTVKMPIRRTKKSIGPTCCPRVAVRAPSISNQTQTDRLPR